MSQKNKSKSSGLFRPLSIELLEDRTMMASDVAAFNEFLQGDLSAVNVNMFVEPTVTTDQWSTGTVQCDPVNVDPPSDTSTTVNADDSGSSTSDPVIANDEIASMIVYPAWGPNPPPDQKVDVPETVLDTKDQPPIGDAPVNDDPIVPVITTEKPIFFSSQLIDLGPVDIQPVNTPPRIDRGPVDISIVVSPPDIGLRPIDTPPLVTRPVAIEIANDPPKPVEASPSTAVNSIYPAAVLVAYDSTTHVATYDYYTEANVAADRRTMVVDGYNVYRLSSLLNAGYLSELVGADAQSQAMNARRDVNQWAQYFGVAIDAHSGSEALGLYDPAKLAQEIASYAGYAPAERALLESNVNQNVESLRGVENLIAVFERRIYEHGSIIANLGAFKNEVGFDAIFAAIDRLISRMNSLTDYQLPEGMGLSGGTISNGTTKVVIPMSEWLTTLRVRVQASTSVMFELNLIEVSLSTLTLQASQLNRNAGTGDAVHQPRSPIVGALKGIRGEINEADVQQAEAVSRYWDYISRFFENAVAGVESQLQYEFTLSSDSRSLDGFAASVAGTVTDAASASGQADQNYDMFALIAQSGTNNSADDDADGSSLATLVTQYNVDDAS